ncbi:MAG: AMP-binding protein, partial [Alphaproteobacteria bacterium]
MDKQAHWKDVGERLDWIKPFTKVQNTSYDLQDFRIRWYEDGTLNACQNCLDRHLEKRADKTAIIWEPDNPSQDSVKLTYRQLHDRVCKVASGLEKLGVRKGDTVTIYMPMIPEVVIAMLACVRIGAVHSVVFGGFSAESLAHRIEDCGSKVLIAADVGMRGGKEIPLKQTVDEALEMAPVETVIVHQYSGDKPMQAGRDVWFHDVEASGVTDHQPVEVGAEDSMFVLYTSGSTGKPKGMVHTCGGYMVYTAYTFKNVFQ